MECLEFETLEMQTQHLQNHQESIIQGLNCKNNSKKRKGLEKRKRKKLTLRQVVGIRFKTNSSTQKHM